MYVHSAICFGVYKDCEMSCTEILTACVHRCYQGVCTDNGINSTRMNSVAVLIVYTEIGKWCTKECTTCAYVKSVKILEIGKCPC